MVKAFGLGLTVFIVSVNAFAPRDYQFLTFKNLKCKIEAEFAYQNFSCHAKSFNRSYSTFSIVGVSKFPLNNIFVKASVLFKYGMIYREALKIPLIDLCPLMKTTSSLRLISQIIKMLKDSAPEMIHDCPYNGLNVRNRSLNTRTLISIFPTGDYKIIIDGFIKNKTLGNIISFVSYNSSNKDTFG